MSKIGEFQGPQKVPGIKTKFREIKTEIPTLESLAVFDDLDKYEARAMHGQLPIVWDRAEGFNVFDKSGNKWIDFTSTIFVANVGHSNPLILEALRKQLDAKLIHTYTFASEIRAEFLKKLVEFTPDFCEKSFLVSSGTEATEASLKLMRMHGQKISPEKVGVISWVGAVHGRTMGAELLKGVPESSSWITSRDPDIHHMAFPYPWNVSGEDGARQFKKDIAVLEKNGVKPDDICGFILESYQGWGAIFYPRSYIGALADFAKEHDILLVFDEIQSGMGRTGKLFAYEHYGVEPDMLCLGKGLGGGVPLSAVIGRREIIDLPAFGSMSSTHSANPLVCAAGIANLTVIKEEKLVEESARKGKILHSRLSKLKEKYPKHISYVLGRGLLAGILIRHPDTGEPDGEFATKICERAMQKGLLLVHTGRESIKIGPPLIIPDAALEEGIDVVEECFGELVKTA